MQEQELFAVYQKRFDFANRQQKTLFFFTSLLGQFFFWEEILNQMIQKKQR